MTTSASLELLEPLGVVWQSLAGLLGSDERALRRPSRFVSEAARVAMDGILSASDRAELIELLDECLLSDQLVHVAAAEQTSRGTALPAAKNLGDAFEGVLTKMREWRLDMPSLVRTLGPAGAARCDDGARAYRALASALLPFVKVMDGTSLEPGERKGPPATMHGLIYGEGFSLGLRRHLLALFRSWTAALAIARAEEGRRPEPWLGLALGEVFAEGPIRALESFERYLAERGSTRLDDERLGKTLSAGVERWKQEASVAVVAGKVTPTGRLCPPNLFHELEDLLSTEP